MFVKVSLAFVFVVLVSSAPTPNDVKCLPEKFTAVVVGKIGQMMNGKSAPFVLHVVADVYMDTTKQMETVHEALFYGEKHVANYTWIKDGAKKINYLIDSEKKTCDKSTDPAFPVERICSNSTDVKLVGSLNVDGAMVDMYNRKVGKGDETFTITRDSFTLVSSVTDWVIGNSTYQMQAMNYGNMTKSISDDSVFTLPSYCN